MRVLIVDDEIIVRTKLKYIFEVEFRQYDPEERFSLCGEASDGKKALELVEKLLPDVVLSDMKMPVMNGLEFIEQCAKSHPEICFIALSNYDDFDYVRGTLMNGAADYILKHNLTAAALHEVLVKAVEKTREKYPGKSGRSGLSDSNYTSLENTVVLNLISGVYMSESMVAQQLSSLNISLGVQQVIPVEMWIKEFRSVLFDEKNILSFSVMNIIKEIMVDQDNGAIGNLGEGRYVLLFSYENLRSERKIQELLTTSLNRIRFCLKKFLDLTVYFFVGNMQKSIMSVGWEYRKIEALYQKKLYVEKDIWISREETGELADFAEAFYNPEEENRLYLAITNGREEEAEAVMEAFFRRLADQKPSETQARMGLIRLLAAMERAGGAAGVQMEEVYRETNSSQEILENPSLREIQASCRRLLNAIFRNRERAGGTALSPRMKRAVDYIYRHYREDLTQSEVARVLGISSSYLSTLFKNELKKSFPVFLTDVRMKSAVHLLEKGELSLKEIASECGFSDYVYFLKSFKKKYACTPKQYLSRVHNSGPMAELLPDGKTFIPENPE